MSDVQPMLYIEDLNYGMAFYGQQLGFEEFVFGHHPEIGMPLIAGTKLEDAIVLLTNEDLFSDAGTRAAEVSGSISTFSAWSTSLFRGLPASRTSRSCRAQRTSIGPIAR